MSDVTTGDDQVDVAIRSARGDAGAESPADAYPHLAVHSPTAAAILDRYEVVSLRGDDHPYTVVPWGSAFGRMVGLLCRRPHDGVGPTVLVTFTAGGEAVLPGLDLRTGDDHGKPIRLEGHQNPTVLAALVDQALGHEAEEHPPAG